MERAPRPRHRGGALPVLAIAALVLVAACGGGLTPTGSPGEATEPPAVSSEPSLDVTPDATAPETEPPPEPSTEPSVTEPPPTEPAETEPPPGSPPPAGSAERCTGN